jgi:histidyl-tRNA synthetase
MAKIIQTFELFGFEPIETPTLEYASLLLGKYGKEADKLVYTFKDRGERELGLRYDQTVPTARVLSQYKNILPKFFRRYQIQNVFRADKPQKGRYREFIQCDIDIFGSNSPVADAEIVSATYFAFKNIGYPQIKVLINDRQTLFDSLKPYVTEQVTIFSLIQSIDKLEKIGQEEVIKELINKGLEKTQAEKALKSIERATLSSNLKGIINNAVNLGVPKEALVFTSTLARGLDYYTGMIFEVILPEFSQSSCAGGGRYDKLIEQLSGINVPAVGIAFGFDRMIEAAEYFKIIPDKNLGSQVLVTVFGQDLLSVSLETAYQLRLKGIKTEVYPTIEKIDKQLKYADKQKIPFVIIIGPEEAQKNILKVKDMKTGEQKNLSLEQTIKEINNK